MNIGDRVRDQHDGSYGTIVGRVVALAGAWHVLFDGDEAPTTRRAEDLNLTGDRDGDLFPPEREANHHGTP